MREIIGILCAHTAIVITRVQSAALMGIDPYVVIVETDVHRGLPKFEIVGLARTAVREGRNRILSALRSSGVEWHAKRVTVNLAPAAVQKDGVALDLPIALGLASAIQLFPPEALEETLVLGELALDGTLRPIRGAFTVADYAARERFKKLILPYPSAREVASLNALEVVAPHSLSELIDYLRGERDCPSPETEAAPKTSAGEALDYADVGGQPLAKRALEIAAAGHHNVLLAGPPGIGKTVLAQRLPSILPQLSDTELREVRKIHGLVNEATQLHDRAPPFRAPHHLASLAGVLGGGRPFQPGEVTLAHRGTLFLDELSEFRRDILESLRQPLELGRITLSRAEGIFHLPAQFLFVAAMNLCPCGALGDPKKVCLCTPPALSRYRSKVSSPIRDRIDIVVELSRPSWEELWRPNHETSSETIRSHVLAARAKQTKRHNKTERWNAHLSHRELKDVASLDSESELLLSGAMDQLGLSARGVDKVLRVARTIADLDDAERVRTGHVAEALQYRSAASIRF